MIVINKQFLKNIDNKPLLKVFLIRIQFLIQKVSNTLSRELNIQENFLQRIFSTFVDVFLSKNFISNSCSVEDLHKEVI